MKEIILIDIDYDKGGHNKIYADAICNGISDVNIKIQRPPKTTKINIIIYLVQIFSHKNKHVHILYVDPLLKYIYVLYPLLHLFKILNRLTITCTYHVYNKNRIMNAVSGLFDGIIVHSDWVIPYLRSKSKICIINYPSFLNPMPMKRLSPKKFRFGFLGGNRKEKRYDLFIEAMNKIEYDIEVVIGGKNTDLNLDGLTLKKEFKLIPRFLTDFELKELIEYIDVIILPYENSFKGQSGPLIESAFASKVIICSDAPVLENIVLRYNLGEVFESGNLEDLIKKIKKVIINYNEYNVSQDFRNIFNVKQFLKDYDKFFILTS